MKKNFLFLCVDQLRFDTLGVYGNPLCQTPNLNQLASEGVSFSKAYTSCPLCTPARASMYTGFYAFKHGMGTNCDMYHSMATELPEPEQLLHRNFLNAGYQCGYQGKWHVGSKKGPGDFGFQGMNVPGYGNYRNEPDFLEYLKKNGYSYSIEKPIYYNPHEKTLGAGIWNGPEESTHEYYLANETIEMMKRYSDSDSPFFLSCHFWGPHMPHLPPATYAGKHDRSKIQPCENFEDTLEDKPNFVKRLQSDFYRNLPGDWKNWQEIIGLYYDIVSFIDAQIGRILHALDELNLRDNTVIIFTTDHGDMQGAHNQSIDKGFLYEEAVRIPLIISGPGIPNDQWINDFASNMDILPTILDLAGITFKKRHGVSLVPLITSGKPIRENVYLEFHGLRFLFSQRALIDSNGYKYIFTAGDFDEVYDLNKDPAELVNVIDHPDYSSIVTDLRSELMKASLAYNDPLVDYIYKIFGVWENPSGRFLIPGK